MNRRLLESSVGDYERRHGFSPGRASASRIGRFIVRTWGRDDVIISRRRARAVGFGVLRPVAFDSQIFGLPMARVDYVVARPEDNRLRRALLDDLLECAHDRKIAHVAFRMPSGDPELVQAAEARGFRLMTTFVGFSRTPSPGQADPAVREARRSDVGPVCAIAREVFSEKTRFHHDSTLSPDRSTEFYVEWTRKCLAGEGADVTLVARDGGRVGGFITGRVLPESGPLLGVRLGTIDMFAVGRRFQGRGLGKMLLDRVLDWFWRQRVGTAQVGTEGFNFPALGLYTSAGFRITRSALTFHRRL